jgi:glycosyltransferase involved in cell wall biosynthesis
MNPRRVAYVLNVFPKLSETFIANELAEVRRRGVDLRVLSLRQPEQEPRHRFIDEAGLQKIVCREPKRFESVLREFQPQLLHAHFATEPADAARQWSQRLGVPFTFTAHGYDIRRRPPPDFAARAAAARALVTVSEANRRYIVETFGVPSAHIRVIPCGVDTERFNPGGSRCQEAQTSSAINLLKRSEPAHVGGYEDPLIVCVARHVKVKNLGMLLEACALLCDRGVRFKCVSVGDGVCRGELEARHAELRLGHYVEFVGAEKQDQVLAWWQRADLAVLTSENEGMPVSLMEATACGVPAVATAVGGIPELIEHGVTGLLSPPGDVAAFADTLQSLLQDSARRSAMSAAARRRAVERFSLSRQVDALLALWSGVLA